VTETYTPPTISNFNDNAPDDDGTVGVSNLVKWQKHIDEIGTPLKNYIDAVSEETDDAFERIDARNARNVLEFGADPTGATSSQTALDDARSWLAAQSDGATLIFPTGIYSYSTSPNWALDNCRVIANGTVRLRYTGTGNALILDGGAAGDGVYNMEVGPFIVEAPSTAGHGAYLRSVHHSVINLNIRGCGTTSAGIQLEWCVANKIYPTISVNEAGSWYGSGTPLYGIYLERRGSGVEDSAYNTIINPLCEGTDTGIYFANSLGNIILGGACESCATEGITFTSDAFQNRVMFTDFEDNNGSDITIDGTYNDVLYCDTEELVTFAATSKVCRLTGGNHHDITVTAGAESCGIVDLVYDRFASGTPGAVTDGGTDTYIRNLDVNTASTEPHIGEKGRAAYNLALIESLPAVGASPWTYTNTSGTRETVAIVTDQAITSVAFKRDGVTRTVSTTHGMFELSPNDAIVLTYPGTAPTVAVYTR